MLIRVDENVLPCIWVSDEVVEPASVIGQSIVLLHRNAALVFDHALEAAINVPGAGYDAAAELVLTSDDEFVRIFHTRAGRKRFTAVLSHVH